MKLLTLVVGMLMLLSTLAIPASAHNAPPCNESGGPGHSDYAQHHIVALAHVGGLGNDGHKPGMHSGYALCVHGTPPRAP